MPNFYAACKDCEKKLRRKLKLKKGQEIPREQHIDGVLFETSVSIKSTPAEEQEAMVCPRCKGSNTIRTYEGYDVVGYIRGNGYLDKAGCKRDMNVFTLTEKDKDTGKSLDPYDHMRQPGEADDLVTKIRKGGKHNPRPKYFDTKVMEKAVEQAVNTPTAE
jgi:hypothetical protein